MYIIAICKVYRNSRERAMMKANALLDKMECRRIHDANTDNRGMPLMREKGSYLALLLFDLYGVSR